MNERVNKFLLTRNKFINERQPVFLHSACGSFAKKKERKKIEERRDSQYIYQNKIGKACSI